MAFEQAKFGDGSASGSGNVTTSVNTHFGAFEGGKTVGTKNTEGVMYELTMDIDGEMMGAEEFALLAPKIPAGSRIEDAFLQVTEVFVMGGTTPTFEVGTEGSEATNGLVISEAVGEALGTYDLTGTLVGTWAGTSGLVAETTVGIALEGDATVTDAGKMRLVIRYVKM